PESAFVADPRGRDHPALRREALRRRRPRPGSRCARVQGRDQRRRGAGGEEAASAACTVRARRTLMDLSEALERIFSVDSELYRGRGFMRRIGYGERPALINIDLANAWTRPGNPFTCDGMDAIIAGVQRL